MMTNLNVCVKGKRNGFISGIRGLFFMCLVAFALSGCEGNVLEGMSDDDSYEARVEEARIALDDGNYSRARSLLAALDNDYPDDPTVLQYLASAYAGLAGLDTFNLLDTIDQLNDQDNQGSIDMIGLVVGDADGVVTSSQVDSDMANLNHAITYLEAIPNPTDDQKVQLGLLALTRASLTISQIIMEDQASDEVTLTEDGIGALYEGSPADFSALDLTDELTSLSNDISRVGDAVTAIESETNDLSESFDQFQDDIDQDQNDTISQTELETYINSL